jgi:hypothetical protein
MQQQSKLFQHREENIMDDILEKSYNMDQLELKPLIARNKICR